MLVTIRFSTENRSYWRGSCLGAVRLLVVDCPLNLVGNENNCCCAKKCERIEVFAVFADFNCVRDRSTKKESLVGRSAERQFEVLQCADPGSLRRGQKTVSEQEIPSTYHKTCSSIRIYFQRGECIRFFCLGGRWPFKTILGTIVVVLLALGGLWRRWGCLRAIVPFRKATEQLSMFEELLKTSRRL